MKEQNKKIERIRQGLKNCNNKLKTVLNITLAINSNQPIRKLLSIFKNILVNDLNIKKFILFWNYRKEWKIILKSYVKEEDYKNIDVDRDLLHFDEIEITFAHEDVNFNFDFIIPIKQNNKKVAFLLIGDVSEGLGMSPSLMHLQFVQTLTNIIIVAIQNRSLIKGVIRQKELKKEMETAAEIQKMLIPDNQKLPKTNYFKAVGFYMPHYDVGGDYYDVIKVSKNEYYFCIADVSGKGISAALLMANFQANLRSLIYNNNFTRLEDLIVELNRIINDISQGDRFITLFLAKYNTKKGRLLYVNAGHPAPLLINPKNYIIELKEGTYGLGMQKEINKINVGKLKIRGKTKLLCFTDGFYEPLLLDKPQNAGKVMNILKKDIPLEQTVKEIISATDISKSNKQLFDDVSILAVEMDTLLGKFSL